jgi:penicillin amidase
MRKLLKRILLIFLIFIVIIVIAGFSFIRYFTHKGIPDYNHDLKLNGLYAPVEDYRDSFAIPHVYAQNEHDLYMAVGYLLAQDRLWQMDMLRHVTEGRLSEIFGADYADTDLLLRALRFREKSDRILSQTDSSCLVAIRSFSDGVNQFIADNYNKLPPEFTILRYKPERWEPYHSLNMIGYMAWDLKAGWSEILLSDIQKTVDSIRYREILPDLLRNQPTVFPLDDAGSFSSLLPDQLLNTAALQDLGADVLDGSNNWAVSGKKSVTGKPMLANDMHLGLNIPGIWYQMHQVIQGKLNVTGLVLPGAPVIICGHNDSIAWGMTNTYVDNLDFYQEKINPDDPGQYMYNGEWRNFKTENTIIKFSNGEQVQKTLQFSHRGPVVSGFKKISGSVVTMHWVGDEMSDEFKAILQVNRANNWNDFTSALRTFTSISQNIAYADIKGNIGLFCAAGIPVRKRDIAFGILPGESDEYDWKGYVPFDELPLLFNPVSEFVVSANNRTAPRDYPYHVGTWYSLPNRYERIAELLEAKELHSISDFQNIQLDQKSKLAEKYLPGILQVLGKYQTNSKIESTALGLLKQWDLNMSSTSQAASIFEALYLRMQSCIFSDELGSRLFGSFKSVSSISRNATDQIMDNRVSEWFDDFHTQDTLESFKDMVICAFQKTVADLEAIAGTDPDSWQWGNMHQLTMEHPLAAVKILDKSLHLNRGPYPVGGSFHTVSPYSYDNNEPYTVIHGSSHRHLYDLSNWDRSLTVIPTGNSGIPASKHYCDQTQMYVKGQYHRDYFSKILVKENAKYHMEFEP